jgi:hypothetical protein
MLSSRFFRSAASDALALLMEFGIDACSNPAHKTREPSLLTFGVKRWRGHLCEHDFSFDDLEGECAAVRACDRCIDRERISARDRMAVRRCHRTVTEGTVNDHDIMVRPDRLKYRLQLELLPEPLPEEATNSASRRLTETLSNERIGSRLGMKTKSPGWRSSAEVGTRLTSCAVVACM